MRDREILVLQLFADEQTQLKHKTNIFPIKSVIPDIYFTTYAVFDFIRPLKNGEQRSHLVTIFGFSNVKSIKITHLFYREKIDADKCNHIGQKQVKCFPSKYINCTTRNTYSNATVGVFV